MVKDIKYYMDLPYKIIIVKDTCDKYFAEVEGLRGCMTQGDTFMETAENIIEAMELWLETAIEKNIDIPEPTNK